MIDAGSPWATRALGFGIAHTASTSGRLVTDIVAPGLRRNPRRAHLLVSAVLGKHIATQPHIVIAAGEQLAASVRDVLGGGADVMGMAETATGLGHCVAAELHAGVYIHTTRRAASTEIYAGFQEGHSHATDHTLQPTSSTLLGNDRPLVIVDDEISTGTTALAAIRALHRRRPRSRYIVASLVDMREQHHHVAAARTAEQLHTSIEHVSLATGQVTLPDNLVDAVHALPPATFNPVVRPVGGAHRRVVLKWPTAIPDGGRHGFLAADYPHFNTALASLINVLLTHMDTSRPVLVVGHEEFMYLPLRVAELLARQGLHVLFQSTTRSPAYVRDVVGYPLRRGFQFCASEHGETAPRYLYNGWPPDDSDVDPQLLLMVDATADSARSAQSGGIRDVLSAVGYDVLVAAVHGTDGAALALHRQRDQP
jgi:adenine/guanine phosphoribosyltransferase-like PRPP-binding protein